ncbi:hypothetical protein AB0O67_29240 [Streptomyces sp. NPDC086077]|uniref:hypothetical protein n=1 Tax=Streptomyces sp. NPDC086077 TaxID=3154862 RepID=UPI0034431239
MDSSVLSVVVVAAALLIKTAVVEIRRPGSARRQWAFVRDSTAVAGGAVVGTVVLCVGWAQARHGALAWALLVAVLTAYLLHHRKPRS